MLLTTNLSTDYAELLPPPKFSLRREVREDRFALNTVGNYVIPFMQAQY